ncbi:MAG: site-2 protease family protein, partial [Geminicoccaceae bacterium]|nr:site-2 protease family protein [Geminicoccaceae bacterium]
MDLIDLVVNYAVPFLIILSVVVFVHEYGHYWVARRNGVRVEVFSIGFGRELFGFNDSHGTRWKFSLIPLGGYVKMLGDADATSALPDASTAWQEESFPAKRVWQRMAIVFAGPAANFLLAVVIYFVFFAGHTELPAAVVGDVLEDSPAARAGLEPGDTVLAIDGKGVRYWEELEGGIQRAPGKELHLRLERAGKVFEKYVVPIAEVVHKRDGTSASQGRIGITRAPFAPLIGVLDLQSPAARAGMQTGDLIISIDGQPIANWGDVAHKLGRGRRTNVVYFRGTEVPGIPHLDLLEAHFADLVPEFELDAGLKRSAYSGLERAEMFVADVVAGSPADVAGLRPGDLIVALDDQPVSHWMIFDQRLQADPGRTWTITYERTGADGKVETHTAQVTQVRRKQLDAYGHTVERLVFGAHNDAQRSPGKMVPIEGRFSYAVSKAVHRTGETIGMMVSGFLSIIGGDSPSESLGGPVMMYKVATVSGSQGWETFLLMMALISINLG